MEALEKRQLLTVTVTTLTDEADNSITDGDVSLRDAVALAPAGETINFAASLTAGGPAKINLTLNAITIAKSLSIIGPGANLLTIDATVNDPTPNTNNRDGHRVFNISDSTGTLQPVTMEGLSLTGADFNGFGGAISSSENLTLRNMVIYGNSAVNGAGVGASGPLSIFDSEIRDNTASSAGGGIIVNVAVNGTYQIVRTRVENNSTATRGGGIFVTVPGTSSFKITNSLVRLNNAVGDGGGVANTGPLLVTNSVFVSNHSNANGGGIKAVAGATIEGSLFESNTAAAGGGIHADATATVTLRSTTFSDNSATGNGGGGFFQNSGTSLAQVTLSGNRATSSGGGVYTSVPILIRHSTIAENQADSDAASGGTGGGIFYTQVANPVTLDHTIVAGNLHGASTGDDAVGGFAASYSLVGIGDTAGLTITDNSGNLIGTTAAPINPMLDALAANNGPELYAGFFLLTRSLQPGSPALDAGDPNVTPGAGTVPLLDARGAGFTRVYNATSLPTARIDIGALEWQPSPLVGDYNFDRIVNAADYTLWRNTVGSTTDKRADGNRDGVVNMADFTAWSDHYGDIIAVAGFASAAALIETSGAADASEPGFAAEAAPDLAAGSSTAAGTPSVGTLSLPNVESQHSSAAPQLARAANVPTSTSDQALLLWLALSTQGAELPGSPADNGNSPQLPNGDAPGAGLDSLDVAFAGLSTGL